MVRNDGKKYGLLRQEDKSMIVYKAIKRKILLFRMGRRRSCSGSVTVLISNWSEDSQRIVRR